MYCTHCGRSVADGSTFCPGCGRPLSQGGAQSGGDATSPPRGATPPGPPPATPPVATPPPQYAQPAAPQQPYAQSPQSAPPQPYASPPYAPPASAGAPGPAAAGGPAPSWFSRYGLYVILGAVGAALVAALLVVFLVILPNMGPPFEGTWQDANENSSLQVTLRQVDGYDWELTIADNDGADRSPVYAGRRDGDQLEFDVGGESRVPLNTTRLIFIMPSENQLTMEFEPYHIPYAFRRLGL